ncbi:hypothetical protein AURDEDRAFT_172768 [Auricularia subglabra TFB-10046 SS5]|nr:hypothetical protein AURDEDRAFT_172768 [Auricularia subglabra TFB-10046 SS5]
MQGTSSGAKPVSGSRQAKPYKRPAQAQPKAQIQRCKCPVCLLQDPLGVPSNTRTIVRHQKNDRRISQVAGSSRSARPSGSTISPVCGPPLDADGPVDGPTVLDDFMDVDPPGRTRFPCVTVEDIPDAELDYRGAEPLPLSSGVLLTAVDAGTGHVDLTVVGEADFVSFETVSFEVDPETISVSDDEEDTGFRVDLDADLPDPAVSEEPAAPPTAPVPGLLIDPERTEARAFHDQHELASLKLPRQPPRVRPLPPAPKLPPFKGALDGLYQSSHDSWYIRSFFALAAVLHYKYHVSYLAVNLLMWTVYTVFTALGLLVPLPERPNLHKFTQARTVLKRLSLHDAVTVYPTCPSCHWIAPPDSPHGTRCAECNEPLFGARSPLAALRGSKPVPLRPWGYIPLSYLLSVKLSDDAIQREIEIEMARRRQTGLYHDMLDGAVMRDMRGHDGKPFFRVCEDGKLRIGVTLNGDGFAPFSSTFRDNHSTTAISAAIASLNIALRYAHLLVPTLIAGPKEPTCQQLQRYLALIVDDLIMLYEHGILVYSEKYPNGRRVRVALVAVVCDHPAMCRMCGFADKAHKVAPCTKCKIGQRDIGAMAGVTKVYEPRTGAEQKRLALEWLELPAPQRDAHYAKHGQQWFELARLDYFDPVRQTVVGPMHCLLNGLVKNLWYETWIKGRKALRAGTEAGTLRELDFIHKLLSTFEAAPWVGRLPKLVGEPAGGSLSADEWKHLGTTFGPLVLPPLWYQTQPAANAEHAGANTRYQKKLSDHAKARERFTLALARKDAAGTPTATATRPDVGHSGTTSQDPPRTRSSGKPKKGAALLPEPVSLEEWLERNPMPRPPAGLRRVEAEVPMFLSFFAALRVLLTRSLGTDDVSRGNALLLEHLRRFCEVYGEEYVKYNQHWATHVPPQIPDFGPVYGFWEFPGEHINKTLKSINTNNRRAGELELTMLRSYNKTTFLMQMLTVAERTCNDPTERKILLHLLSDDRQVRGTVDAVVASQGDNTLPSGEEPNEENIHALADADAATKDDEFVAEHNLVKVAAAANVTRLSAREQRALLMYYRALGFQVHAEFDARLHAASSAPLSGSCTPHLFIILDGRRIHSTSSSGASASALVKLCHRSDDATLRAEQGEVLHIFTHSHLSMQRTFATIRTFKSYAPGLFHDSWGSWSAYPEIDVKYWHTDKYKEIKVVPIEDIACQVARVRYEDPALWMTVSLEKHRIRR